MSGTGVYALAQDTPGDPFDNAATCIHIHRTDQIADQIVIDHLYGSVDMVARGKAAGEWNPWEYINPRNQYSIEYRTTERFRNATVYVQSFYLGQMPSSGGKSVTIGKGITVVDIVGFFFNDTYDMPLVCLGTYVKEIYYNRSVGTIQIDVNNTDAANYKCIILAKYTKTDTLE